MRIGYPCVNNSIGCSSARTFRLASYSEERLRETIAENLQCLWKTLEFNAAHGLLFFRISSQLVPFASHAVCCFPWQKHFAKALADLGAYVRREGMRISMHPDQFVLINAADPRIVAASVAELRYQCEVLDLMELPASEKVQIHVGGVYGDKEASLARFAEVYQGLPADIRKRLVIENDDHLYSVADCLSLHERTGVPILFDTFHHQCLGGEESSMAEAFAACSRTWAREDGVIMVDYSSQQEGERKGKHAEHIDLRHFKAVMKQLAGDCDVMLEIRDKEASALKALRGMGERARILQ